MNLVQDYMTRDFTILRCDRTSQNAIAVLTDVNFGIIENTDGQPISIVTKADVDAAITQGKTNLIDVSLETLIFEVRHDVQMQKIVNSSLLATLIQSNVIVKNHADEIVGILSKAEIQQFMRSGQSQQKGATLGFEQISNLGGERLAGSFRPVMMQYYVCRECWYRNTLDAEQAQSVKGNLTHALSCQNPDSNVQPHDLKLN